MAKSPAVQVPDVGAPDLVPPTNLALAVVPGTPLTVTPPLSGTLTTVLPALFFRVKMSLPDPWITPPTRLSAVPGAVPGCALVLATADVGSVQPRSPMTRAAPGAMYTQ